MNRNAWLCASSSIVEHDEIKKKIKFSVPPNAFNKLIFFQLVQIESAVSKIPIEMLSSSPKVAEFCYQKPGLEPKLKVRSYFGLFYICMKLYINKLPVLDYFILIKLVYF